MESNKLSNKNWKSFAYILSGNFAAQLISLLFYPLLVRIYTPQDFGVFGTYTSLIVVSSIFASGQLHMAFIKTTSENETSEVLWLFNRFALIGTIFTSIIVFLLNLKFEFLESVLLILFPFSLITFLMFESKKMLSVKEDKFKEMSHAIMANRIGSNLSKLLMATIAVNPWILIISEIITNLFSSNYIKKKLATRPFNPTEPNKIFRKFSQFPLFATFSSFFQLGLIELPVIFLAAKYSQTEIGYYILILRILLQPLAVIGNSFGSVVSKRLVVTHEKRFSSRALISQFYTVYFALGGLIVLLSFAIPANWYEIILGQNWISIKNILLPLSLTSASKLSSGLHIYYYVAINQMKIKSLFKAIQLGAVIGCIVFLPSKSFEELVWIICIIEAGVDFVFVLYTIRFQSN